MKCETPGPRAWLVPRAGADPEPERDRPHAAQRLADDALAAGERRDVRLAHRGDGIGDADATVAEAVAEAERRRRLSPPSVALL